MLAPIVTSQKDLTNLFQKIDDDNSNTNEASSLAAMFSTDFPRLANGKCKINQTVIGTYDKMQLASLVTNVYKIIQVAQKNRYFRSTGSQASVAKLVQTVDKAIKHVRTKKIELAEPKLLRGEKRTPKQEARQYCQDGGKKPDDSVFQFCVFCKHQFVDEVPENQHVLEHNEKVQKEHSQLKEQFDLFKAGKRKDPPVGKKGKPITSRMPSMKMESFIYQCHCFQMRCAREGVDVGSTCEMGCMNRKEGKRYLWKYNDEGMKVCTCPVCLCQCRKAYKHDDIDEIMTQLALQESENGEGGGKENEGEHLQHQQKAQELISKAFAYGYERRATFFEPMMKKMKETGKF